MDYNLSPILQASPLLAGLDVNDSRFLNFGESHEVDLPRQNGQTGFSSSIVTEDESPGHDFFANGLSHFRLGISHIAHLLKEFKGFEWIDWKAVPKDGMVYAQLYSFSAPEHIQLELYTAKDRKRSVLYNFRLYGSGDIDERTKKVLEDCDHITNELLLKKLMKVNRPYRIACLLKDL